MPKLKMDRSILEAALVGLGHTLGEVTAKMTEIKRMLGRDTAHPQTTRKPLSAAARARIAAAQRKRWAASKKQGQTAAPAKQSSTKKRRISPAARKRMAEATRKRWAEYRANNAKAAG